MVAHEIGWVSGFLYLEAYLPEFLFVTESDNIGG